MIVGAEQDDAVHHDRRSLDRSAGRVAPFLLAGLDIESIELAVVRAAIEQPPHDRRRATHPSAGRKFPGLSTRLQIDGEDLAVVATDECLPIANGGRADD